MTWEQIIVIIVFIFALISLGVAVYLIKRGNKVLSSLSLSIMVALIIIGAVAPHTIKELEIEIGKFKFSLKRHVSSESENEQVIDVVKQAETKDISDEPLVKAAEKRKPEEKAATDYLLLATNAWKIKRYEEGMQYAYSGLALNPDDKRIKARLENLLGGLFENIGATEQAVKQFKKAMQTDHDFSWPHNNLGALLSKQDERSNEANDEYRKAIEMDPKYVKAHNNLGNLLDVQDGRSEEAESEYRKAIEMDPKYADAHYNLGILLQKKGQLEEAKKEYQKANELDPNLKIPKS